jgi:hypothetical protein
MNKELKSRIFDVPQNILDKINHTIQGLNGVSVSGIDRAKNIINDKKVTYGQLKKIIHDLTYMDAGKDKQKYDLYGGDLMKNWGKQFLQGERDLIVNRKEGRKNADSMTAMTGERKNSFLKKHTKKPDFLPPLNMMKSNSHASSVSSLSMGKLFEEEINRIKKLML